MAPHSRSAEGRSVFLLQLSAIAAGAVPSGFIMILSFRTFSLRLCVCMCLCVRQTMEDRYASSFNLTLGLLLLKLDLLSPSPGAGPSEWRVCVCVCVSVCVCVCWSMAVHPPPLPPLTNQATNRPTNQPTITLIASCQRLSALPSQKSTAADRTAAATAAAASCDRRHRRPEAVYRLISNINLSHRVPFSSPPLLPSQS